MSYLRVDDSDWWVSDVASPDYNTHQRCAPGTCPFDESTSENLGEQGAVYDYALVMGVNAQRVPGAGSAFFVHVTDGAPTAGCVAIPASTLVSILSWVGPGTVIALTALKQVGPPCCSPAPTTRPPRPVHRAAAPRAW